MSVITTTRGGGRTYLCPVDVPLTVLGGKWKLLIVYYLLQQPRRNGELRRLISSISQKVLTERLRELEADGIVERTAYQEVPPRVDYAIAAAERPRLESLVHALCEWGVSWAADTGGSVRPALGDARPAGHAEG